MTSNTALVIVDMQKYYLDVNSAFHRYFELQHQGAMSYISRRCQSLVIPNIQKLISSCRKKQILIIYLRLCSQKEDRSDLQRAFYLAHQQALQVGTADLYPLANDSMADVVDEIKPVAGDWVIDKKTFSAFTSTDLEKKLRSHSLSRLIFTGLATSQCVDTTARDAADRGFEVVHIDDAQADYQENVHLASLYASAGVCGGMIMNSAEMLMALEDPQWFSSSIN